jgi:predicted nucleic acid-binding protein
VIVLDTNVVTELMKAAPEGSVLSWIDARPHAELWITAITAAELHFGVARLPAGKRKAWLTEQLRQLVDDDLGGRVLAFDRRAAEVYGPLAARRERKGLAVALADLQIAAICEVRSASLATRNTPDFLESVGHLINPWTT